MGRGENAGGGDLERHRPTVPGDRHYNRLKPCVGTFPISTRSDRAAQGADVVPVYRQLLSDHLTPVTAFEVLGRDDHAFLLESVVGGEKIARYSFIATSPALVYQAASGRASITRGGRLSRAADEFATTDPLADLQKLLPPPHLPPRPALPAFTGGLVGYAGYDTIRYYEGEKLPSPPKRRPPAAGPALRPVQRAGRLRPRRQDDQGRSPTRVESSMARGSAAPDWPAPTDTTTDY